MKEAYAFWMVYGEGQRAPTYKHRTAEAAHQEATRLAGENVGITFFVLKAKTAVESCKPVMVSRPLKKQPSSPDDDGLPF